MNLPWTRIAALLGFVGVGLGAFGAHGLESIADKEQLGWWHTAVLYHLLHVPPLLALDHVPKCGAVLAAGRAFVAGVLVFSGTLYAMGLGAPTWLGAITPIGGLALMFGWGALAYASTARAAEREQNAA
jgi:uncharacterized membrane protein YgdD (TMEM256/DUF423 family)